ncbi:MAG: WG repeat-containing protein, partial [Flavobacteriales bacterium]
MPLLPRLAALAALATLAPTGLFAALGPFKPRLQRAFEALEVHDYFLARKCFLQQARRHPAAAWYGLSVITGRANNPFYNEDSCYTHIVRADAAFAVAQAKERERIARFGVDQAAIAAQMDHAFRLGWDRAKSANSIEAYERYIQAYAQSPYAAEAALVRDHLAFQLARQANTAQAYREFLERYTGARDVHEARTRYHEAVYRESTAEHDIASFRAFIRDHPDNPWVQQAEEEIYRLSTSGRSVAEYAAFIRENPRSRKVNDAWRALYESYTRNLSASAITRFLQDYPDYPFVEELISDYNTASLFLLPFRRDGLWGYIDDQGNERIKAEYEWVEPFLGAQALVGKDGRVGTINRSGRVVVPIEYDEVSEAVDGTSTVERAGRVGAVDRNGTLVVPMVFEDVGEFSGGLAYAASGGRYGYINAHGAEAIPFVFSSASTFKNGLAVVERDGLFGAIDVKGNVVVPPEYDWVEGFDQPVCRVRKAGKVGLVSTFGDLVAPLEYDHIGPFRDGLALAVQGRKCGYITPSGSIQIPIEYEAPEGVASWGDFTNGLAEVQQGGKRCLINTRNERVFPCVFADIGPPTGALVPVRRKTRWGYADRRGNVLFDNRYDQAGELV